MRISHPKPFFFQTGKRAVLLLHGFTGNSSDVRMLGRFLEKHNYTSIAPHYEGHGVEPEKLIVSNPKQWWADVEKAYNTLIESGYEEIAVVGLSLGGVMSLKIGTQRPVKGIVTMCAPMSMKTTDLMFEGVLKYASDYKRYEGKQADVIEIELEAIRQKGMPALADLRSFVYEVRDEVDMVYAPLLVVQGRLDKVIDVQSANYIFETAQSPVKNIHWYENSGHVITLDKEKNELHDDILTFLESLDWHV